MQNLAPHFILEKYALGESSGQFHAASLFIDISGFSAVTSALCQHGSEAAEVMADIMFNIFEPMVEAVYAQGGFISGFAGDAFTALFPAAPAEEPDPLPALAAALSIQTHLAAAPVQETVYGRFPFAVKLGVGAGRVDWGILRPSNFPHAVQEKRTPADGPLAVYYFNGPAVETAAQAEHHAQPGNLILSPEVAPALAAYVQTLPVGEEGHIRLLSLAPTAALPPPVELPPPTTLAGQEYFVPLAIREHSANSGEFRQVVSVFINLMGVQSLADLEPFVQSVFALQLQYGGYLARVDFGDKGCNLLLFWGAVGGNEDDIERALNFTLALGEVTPGSYRAGLTYQMMYAGLAGSARRGEWTCYGEGINLAARLMMAAPWGGLWLDERIARRSGRRFVTQPVGERVFKGFAAPQPVYALIERRQAEGEDFFHGQMVGRQAEMERLEEFAHPLLAAGGGRRCAGILVVEGEAGLGKSRLVAEFLQRITTPAADGPGRVQWTLCQTDPIVRAPFNPFRYWLSSYFQQSLAESTARNKRAFGRVLDSLIAATSDKALQAELNQGRSFLGALLDLHWENSPYAGLEPQGRYELTLTALTTLIRAESLRCPLILDLEDVHCLDDDSRSFVARLVRVGEDIPFAILATARPLADGQPLFAEAPYERMELGLLQPDDMEKLAQDVLGGPVEASISELLNQRAEGNPFFAEQILLYLREQGGIVSRGGRWRSVQVGTEAKASLPSDVRAIFTSRLDGLSAKVRKVVQTAAILGREFEVRVLVEMLGQEKHLPEFIQQAETSDIWTALTEIHYLFKHALLRDAAYEMQLRAQRRELHRLAAEALEKLYAADLAPHYTEIAYHYQAACRQGQATVRLATIDYLEKAGQRFAAAYQNAAARQAFTDAIDLLEPDENEQRWKLLLQREAVYALMGDRTDQLADLEALHLLAEAGQRPSERAVVALRQARYAEAISDYPQAIAYAQAATGWAQAAGRVDLEAEAQWIWGLTFSRQSNCPAASEHAQQALILAHAAGQVVTEAFALRLLGLVDWKQSNFSSSQTYYEQSLQLCRSMGDQVNEGGTLMNLGLVALALGDFEASRSYLEQAIEIYRATGNWRGVGKALNNLGNLATYLGDFATALSLLEQSLSIVRMVGDRWSESSILIALGEVLCDQEQPGPAVDYAEQALVIVRQLGDRQLEIYTFFVLGWAALLQQDANQARIHFAVALAISQDVQNAIRIAESQAGLAEALLKLGDAASASGCLEQVLPFLVDNPRLDGAARPFLSLLYIGQTLLALNDPRGVQVVNDAYRHLQERAAKIQDETARRVFLENVPENRSLCTLFARLQDGEQAAPQEAAAQQQSAKETPPEKEPSTASEASVNMAFPEQQEPPSVTSLPPETAPEPEQPQAARLDQQVLAAQVTALLEQAAKSQGVTLVILGDVHVHIQQIVLNEPPAAPPSEA